MNRYFKAVVVLAVVAPACDQFVCSRERIKAMELNNKGVEEAKNNLFEGAERDFMLAISTDPTYVMSRYNLGKVYQKQRKWDKAIEAFEAATDREPTNANYFYDLGEAYAEAKKLDGAERAFKKATELGPELYKAHWRLGEVYKALEKAKEADGSLRKAIEANPRFDKPFVQLGHLYLDYDAAKEAEVVFSECVRANETSAECFNGHGLALKDLKQYEPAVAEFKKAVEIEPGLQTAIYNCGMTYADWYEQSHATEQKDKAREYLQKFVSGGGGKDGGFGYIKAANDKLYALSGS
jgi:tetratricopeptide (TPR) repeat protein